MSNSFVLNLDRNLQNIKAEDESTTAQTGELIIKGYSEHILETEDADESFDIVIEVPAELFKYAKNVLRVSGVSLTANHNVLEGMHTVTLVFAPSGEQ